METAGASSNFAMAVDPDEHRLLVVFRSPAKLMVFATPTGKLEGSFDICRDADDVFVDPQRRRLYAMAVGKSDVRTALACLRDSATLLDLYPSGKVEVTQCAPRVLEIVEELVDADTLKNERSSVE